MSTPANMLTTFQALMKDAYSDWQIPISVIKKSPFLMALKHDENAYGLQQRVTIQLGPGAGRSQDFATAQSLAAGSQNVYFQVPWQHDYAVCQLDAHSVDFSEGPGAIQDMVEFEVDTKSKNLLNSLGNAIYGDGTGRIGQSSPSDAASASTITLTNANDVINFHLGDVVAFAAPGASSVRAGTAQITGVDPIAGTLSFGSAITGSVPTWAPNDLIYTPGDFGTGQTAGNGKVMGLQGWLPGPNLTSSPFFGLDRTQDKMNLGGWYFDYSQSAISIEQTILNATQKIGTQDANPDVFYCHPNDWVQIQSSLGSLTRIEQQEYRKNGATYGFPAIHLVAGTHDVAVLSDPFCPQGTGFLLQMDTWILKTKGALGKFISDQNGEILRTRDQADVYEARMVYRGNLICKQPRWNARIALPVQLGR